MPPHSRFWQRLTSPLRRLRWTASAWSTKADQAFHDSQFAALSADPFSPSYPGYLTIRRFADLAERSLDDARIVLDLGCGPGEITCELARRRPQVVFTGIDHSEVGIATARRHAARLKLENVVFETGDIERHEPVTPVDVVMMFDAFHHLLDPRAFVSRLRRSTRRFFLVEPAGTWSGDWNRSQDLDWLPETIGQIGRRLEYQFGIAPDAGESSPAAPEPAAKGEPTEHRYTLSDFERFFDGYALDIRGTIAGLERYGPGPDDRSSFRDRIGTLTYDVVVSLENVLYEEGVDLAAKHWAIAAVRGPASDPVGDRMHRRLPRRASRTGLLSAYGVSYGECSGTEIRRGQAASIRVPMTNTGWLTWDSTAQPPVFASYHWLDRQGRMLVHDGERTPFPSPVAQGQSCTLDLRVVAPDTTGRVTLVIDLVHEGRTWFSEQGATVMDLTLEISN